MHREPNHKPVYFNCFWFLTLCRHIRYSCTRKSSRVANVVFRVQTDGTCTWSTVNVRYCFPENSTATFLGKTFLFLHPIMRRYYTRTKQSHVRMIFIMVIVIWAEINRKVDYTLARTRTFYFCFGSIIFIFTWHWYKLQCTSKIKQRLKINKIITTANE